MNDSKHSPTSIYSEPGTSKIQLRSQTAPLNCLKIQVYHRFNGQFFPLKYCVATLRVGHANGSASWDACFSPWRLGFTPRLGHVGLWWPKGHCSRIFSKHFSFCLPTYHPTSVKPIFHDGLVQ